MKQTIASILILLLGGAGVIQADMLGNPGAQVGVKNLFVGLEYSNSVQTFDFDTSELDITSERANLKVTTGLTNWFDIFLKVGGASLMQDYKENYYAYQSLGYAISNYDSEMDVGFGGGGRLRLYNNVDTGLRLFVQGGGYYYTTEGEITWQRDALTTFTKDRETTWADVYAGAGIAKRMDFIDIQFGFGVSQVRWLIKDTDIEQVGNAVSRVTRPERDSWETTNPLFGFIGIDFVLPYEYRLSAQAGIMNAENMEFSVAISQGLERD